ncbi:MAG: hypothetical protein VX938_04385 [Myxococcota bacterium]|nr:hypothetical protein [Myxococcota bacterium]
MDRVGRYHPGAADQMGPMEAETLQALEQLGVGVDWFHHEDAPGQYKVGLEYRDALSMGDGLLTYGQVVRQIGRRHGFAATFMPKPFTDREGSGLHFTLSLMNGDDNVFADGADTLGLSQVARGFIAGLLLHGREITLVTNPTVNSYKRLVPGFAAPTRCTWADSGRGDLVRIPALVASETTPSSRLEYRVADPSCNPYLALASVLEAGLDGVDRELAPPPRRTEDGCQDGTPLPKHLSEAISAASDSELLKRVLGEALHAQMLTAATDEWASYHRQVSQWELDNYLR